MQTLKSFLDQSLLIWKDSTAAARFGLALMLVICVGAFTGFGYWSVQPHYVTLATDLPPQKLGEVADALDSADISYAFKGASTILVDKRELPRARIETSKFGIQAAGVELEASTPWDDPDGKREVFRRNRERELEVAIQKFEAIESAVVQLSIPEKQAFIRQSTAPTAAVVLELSPATKFGESQAIGVAKLVASSIGGLTVDQVTITDTSGKVYESDESLGNLSSQEEYRLARERELTQKIEWILSPTLGYGNAAVSVTTEFEFPEGTIKTTEYDADKKVVTDETLNSTTTTDNTPAPGGGVTGTGSNVGNAATSANRKKAVLTETEDIVNKYLPSMTERFESTNTPIMNAMAISVVVNKSAEEGAVLKEKLQALVQQAVGFREAKDQISIEFIEFVEPAPMEVPPAFALPWDQINNVLKNVSLAVAAIIALLVARSAFKKVQPEPSASVEVADRASQVNQLSELVKQNPEVFSKIISSWSNLDSDEKASSSQVKKAA
jgi:flagellar M-ring protein FliF